VVLLILGIKLKWLGLEKLFPISLVLLAIIFASLRYLEKIDMSTFTFFMGTIVGVIATLADKIVGSLLKCSQGESNK